MENKVSIIVPIYNVENFLEKSINSLINQTYYDIEIILIDDGSTDRSSKIIDEYAIKDSRIIAIHKKNTGVSDTRNVGLSKVSGKYITFIDADDYVEKDYIEEVMKVLKKYKNLDLVNVGFFSETIKESTEIFYDEKLYETRERFLDDFINLWDHSMLYNIWNKIYLKSIIEDNNIKFKNQYFGEDIEFNKEYFKYVNRVYNIRKCYYHYIRERKGAATNKYNSDIFEIRLKEYSEFNRYFEEMGIKKEDYIEFSSRRYIERTFGCVQNVFIKDCKKNFKEKYKYIESIIKNEVTRECLNYMIPKSKKIKIMLIPYKYNLILLTMLMGKIFNIVKEKCPDLFNKMKNKR